MEYRIRDYNGIVLNKLKYGLPGLTIIVGKNRTQNKKYFDCAFIGYNGRLSNYNIYTDLNYYSDDDVIKSIMDYGYISQKIVSIENPECGYHPEQQLRIAKIITRLVNNDVKVLITTNSDYIVKQINTLIMLNFEKNKEYIKLIIEREGFRNDELISVDKINCYEVIEKQHRYKIKKIKDVNDEYGIVFETFDDVIDKINKIQDDIVCGE